MHGFLVPRDHRQAMDIDLQNGNTKWKDSEDIELAQVDEYDTFEDKGKGYKPGNRLQEDQRPHCIRSKTQWKTQVKTRGRWTYPH